MKKPTVVKLWIGAHDLVKTFADLHNQGSGWVGCLCLLFVAEYKSQTGATSIHEKHFITNSCQEYLSKTHLSGYIFDNYQDLGVKSPKKSPVLTHKYSPLNQLH